jgi:ATP-dependent RNA helicase DDX27
VLNSPGVTLESVEFLVLDEADRLLDLGFQEEVHELLRHCPAERRQTMLFSATMNTKVDDLARLSLKRPVRVRTTTTTGETAAGGQPRPPTATKDVEVAPRLEQEFVRVRAGNEGVNREGMLLALLTRTFRSQTIVFFDTKAEAHRMMIICGLCGIRCSELHGNLTQQQRLQALEEFKMGRVDVLLASDLACRGLDIDSVRAVINFEMPSNLDTYIHRIGRTARAGRGGQSCTLIGESRRHLMKEIIRNAEAARKNGNNRDGPAESSLAARVGVVKSRTIPPTVVAHFVDKIRDLEPHIEEVLQAEAVAKMDRLAEMEAIKVQNIIEHSDEIQSRPRKEWFASKSEKERTRQSAAEKQRQIDEKVGTGTHRMTRKKRRAREALAALNSAPDEPPRDGDEEAGEGDVTPSSSNKKQQQQQTVNIKADARKKKKVDAARILEASEKSLRELDEEREARTNAAVNHRKKRKASALSSSSGGHAPGDGSLFDEDKIAHSGRAKKKKEEAMSDSATAMSSYQFRGYDPNRRLGKKRGNKSFKSKSKYKRRK